MSFLEQIKALEENRSEETSNTKTIRLYEETKSILARKYDACVLFNEDRKYIDYENICLSNNIDLGLLNELCKKDDIELSFVIAKTANNVTSISGRSIGKKSIANILSRIGGGGDKMGGAAQFENLPISKVSEKLNQAIKEEE